MKSLIITDFNNNTPINLSYLEVFVQYYFNCLETRLVKWDSNPNMDMS